MKPEPLWKDAVSLAEFLQPPVKRNVYSINVIIMITVQQITDATGKYLVLTFKFLSQTQVQ